MPGCPGNDSTSPLWVTATGQTTFFRGDDERPRPEPGAFVVRCVGQLPALIMPAPTVTPVASSMRMKEPVVRFLE